MSEREYVEMFGKMMKKPEMVMEVESLILSIPDAQTFSKIRGLFFKRYHVPFLPSFLYDLNPENHVRILNAFEKACSNYK
jgi:hypothetical protein